MDSCNIIRIYPISSRLYKWMHGNCMIAQGTIKLPDLGEIYRYITAAMFFRRYNIHIRKIAEAKLSVVNNCKK